MKIPDDFDERYTPEGKYDRGYEMFSLSKDGLTRETRGLLIMVQALNEMRLRDKARFDQLSARLSYIEVFLHRTNPLWAQGNQNPIRMPTPAPKPESFFEAVEFLLGRLMLEPRNVKDQWSSQTIEGLNRVADALERERE